MPGSYQAGTTAQPPTAGTLQNRRDGPLSAFFNLGSQRSGRCNTGSRRVIRNCAVGPGGNARLGIPA